MDYETYARTFCEMQFMQAKRKMEEEQSISPRGGDRCTAVYFQLREKGSGGGYLKIDGLSPGRVTNILNMLEKRGYIEREHDEADRRKVYVALTKSGGKHLQEKYEETIRYISGIFRGTGGGRHQRVPSDYRADPPDYGEDERRETGERRMIRC